jgi:hypothetical protein
LCTVKDLKKYISSSLQWDKELGKILANFWENEAKIVMSKTFEVGNKSEKSYSDGCGLEWKLSYLSQ